MGINSENNINSACIFGCFLYSDPEDGFEEGRSKPGVLFWVFFLLRCFEEIYNFRDNGDRALIIIDIRIDCL